MQKKSLSEHLFLKKRKRKKTNTWRSYALGSMKEHCVKYRRKIFGKPKFPAQSWATRPKLCGNCAFSQNFHVNKLGWPFHDGGRSHIETSPLICSANQWTGFYMITASVMKGLNAMLWVPVSKTYSKINTYLKVWGFCAHSPTNSTPFNF